ncbi:L-threonylcarbamoyladenylate synthase [Georgenia subflava]|uniref:L-threonylcarbamoyladenylate synthase n=1 Tax=Georgenia subflava TaxID=1622177 RepID=A0A6N7END9_9MICO|nr:L-threonylcarbamoyladenylate synthase [Georgenia subflava]MPV38971.1 threonylcarbamoyl-AMP synthase [Georgenia subflava]
MSVYDCNDETQRSAGLDDAVTALGRGALAVLPTDTVYGLAADAFDARAVALLLSTKGRGRQMPPPVLVGSAATLDGLATEVPDVVRDLVEAFWPGPLTIICLAQPSLAWDLGDTDGTVALRMPADPTALALLRRTGPLAVSSANLSGQPAATTAAEAVEYFGDAVAVYLDAGTAGGGTASTIVDATAERLLIVREGALSRAELAAVAPELEEEAAPVTGSGGDDGAAAIGDGTAGDGTASDGAAGDGTASDGAAGDGTASDGAAGDGTASDGAAGGRAGGHGIAGDGSAGDGSAGGTKPAAGTSRGPGDHATTAEGDDGPP